MRYIYTSWVTTHGNHGASVFAGDDAHASCLKAEQHASHLFRQYTNEDVAIVSVVTTRSCAECQGTGAVKGPKGRARTCPDCGKRGVSGEFVGSKLLARTDHLAPCTGACCDGVDRVRCERCGYARAKYGACENPACMRRAREEYERECARESDSMWCGDMLVHSPD